MIFDTHAHYNDSAFNEDRDEVIRSLINSGVGYVVNIASGMNSCISSMKLAAEYDFMYASVGVHPEEIDNLTEEDMLLIEKYVDGEIFEFSQVSSKIVAIGEIGLDYHYPESDEEENRKLQKEFFIRQLDIARRKNKPVIVHSRDAAEETMDIMKAENVGDIGGVVHCFSYSYEMAKQYVDMGMFIGIGGVVTFKNGKKLKECAEKLPLDRIVLETDCPYLSPEPNRGKRNTSANLTYVVSAIANIRGISEEEVIRVTEENAHRLYRL